MKVKNPEAAAVKRWGEEDWAADWPPAVFRRRGLLLLVAVIAVVAMMVTVVMMVAVAIEIRIPPRWRISSSGRTILSHGKRSSAEQ